MSRRFVLLVGIIAVTAALTACSSDSTSGSTSGTTKTTATKPNAAEIGSVESACPLPVTFTVADKWKPAAVSDGTSTSKSGELLCEISARATGQTGFMRVYRLTEVPDAQAALTRSTSRSHYTGFKFTDITTGAGAGKQVEYNIDSGGTTILGLAFAVPVAGGVVVIELNALDEETRKANMPAFELAKSTLKMTT